MKKQNNKRFKDLTLLAKNEKSYFSSPDQAKLEAFDNIYTKRDYNIQFLCPEFTAICPVTGQPDFGEIIIDYVPNKKCIESKSLKIYLFAFRNFPTFHEEVVNKILDDCVTICMPRKMKVSGHFNARGGISLNISAQYSNNESKKSN